MSRRNLIWIAMIVALTIMFYGLPRMAAEQDSIRRSYRPLAEVDALIRQHYVEPVSDALLAEGAIRGMMRRLDPYSGYIGEEEMEAFHRGRTGQFIGVGVETGFSRGELTVIAPVDDGPAMRAGVRAGDIILAVDGRPTDHLTVSDVSELLHGQVGTDVTLTVLHRGGAEPQDIVVTRGPVSLQGVKGFRHLGPGRWDYLIDPEARVAYVRVSCFMEHTIDPFDAALTELRALEVTALILDLRFNGGGVMSAAIEMADRFLSEGVIVSTVTRRQAVREYLAHDEGLFPDVPLVVLINGASASAAEIVAGALQAHGRATIVGSRSFGKGVVQHVIDLHDPEAALRLTVAYYRLPDGRIIHRTPENAATQSWGIIPDVEVTLTETEIAAIQENRCAVDAACASPSTQPASDAGTGTPAAAADWPALSIDRQLARALEIALRPPASTAAQNHERGSEDPRSPTPQ